MTIQIGVSISRSMGTGINVGSRNWSKLGSDTGVNIKSKIEIESQGWGSGHIHIQVQSHWIENLLICRRFEICQEVQICVMKLSLDQSLQDTKILCVYQYG